MVIKLFFGATLLFCASLIISGCRTAKTINYVHEPPDEFYRSMKLESENLKDFKDEEVLFTIDINEVRHGSYIVWLGIYSHESPSVTIKDARIVGGDREIKIHINKEIKVELAAPDSALFKGRVQIFDFDGKVLDKFFIGSSSVAIELRYAISGTSRNMVFYLERKEEKHTVFPT